MTKSVPRNTNLVLGERRALSVKRYLESLGMSQGAVDVTSYGKDRPLCLQVHNPVCWQKNCSIALRRKR